MNMNVRLIGTVIAVLSLCFCAVVIVSDDSDATTCPTCNGAGYTEYEMCSYCVGVGYVDGETCPVCHGDTNLPVTCSTCNGSGIVSDSTTEPSIDFTSPAAVESISGSTISYQATTNVSGTTFTKSGGTASWLSITSAGKLTGTAPSVTFETDYTFIIKATSPGGQTSTQTVTFTIFPVAKIPALLSPWEMTA